MDMIDLSESGDESVLAQLGRRIARYRLNRNMTQAQLAHAGGLSRKTVSRAERGESIDLVSLVRVLRGLNLNTSLDALMPAEPQSPLRVAREIGAQRQRARPGAPTRTSRAGLPWLE
jgi:transcriptional regulator with XRE-family HTH domain